MSEKGPPLIIITGPTASGKTKLAVQLAVALNGEIISADSRQVYRGMDIGTGKDLSEYQFGQHQVSYHLIDIRKAGDKYNLFEYQKDFANAYEEIAGRGKLPIVSGGTGLYIEAVLKSFRQTSVPVDDELRKSLEAKEKSDLEKYLETLNKQKLGFDISTKKRIIRAIEICQYLEKETLKERRFPSLNYRIFCLKLPREVLLRRIESRLKQRLTEGLVGEVEELLQKGVSMETLKYYGLEYKFVAQYLDGEFAYDEMTEKLNVAIRQYAKRQMTWFRRMERNGFRLTWVDGLLPLEDQFRLIRDSI